MSLTSPPFGAGGLEITVEVGPGPGAAAPRRVLIASTRPVAFSGALFVGRRAGEVPALAARLHALCGHAHAVAAAAAIEAARTGSAPSVSADDLAGLAAERLGEHLRSVFTSRGLGPAAETIDDATLADLRGVLGTARTLDASETDETRRAAAAPIVEGLDRLGLAIEPGGRFRAAPGSWAATLAARIGPADGDVFLPVDALRAEDDAAVIAALAADPKGFSARPELAGRRPETGPLARVVTRAIVRDGRARLTARLAEIAEAGNLITAPLLERVAAMTGWIAGGGLERGCGWSAVESPRGRLHHLVRLDGEGRIAAYAVLAPTEWNFHADGPLAATLLANRYEPGEAGAARATRIAALFDPCVGFEASIREVADA